MSLSRVTLQFDPEWRMSLVTALLLPALVMLGFWQLQRADEKSLLAQNWELQRAQKPVSVQQLEGLTPERLAYRSVGLEGQFLAEQYYLLDNRVYGGVFGYEVLSPFVLQGQEQIVLVNRGWLAGDPARIVAPVVSTPMGKTSITGHVYVSPGKPYMLAEELLSPGWPKTVQSMDMIKLAPPLEQLAGMPVFNYPIRIDGHAPGALMVNWQIVNVSPEKHIGYAVQWFTMSVVLLFFYILRSSNLQQYLATYLRKSD